jgi:hypothetical protein
MLGWRNWEGWRWRKGRCAIVRRMAKDVGLPLTNTMDVWRCVGMCGGCVGMCGGVCPGMSSRLPCDANQGRASKWNGWSSTSSQLAPPRRSSSVFCSSRLHCSPTLSGTAVVRCCLANPMGEPHEPMTCERLHTFARSQSACTHTRTSPRASYSFGGAPHCGQQAPRPLRLSSLP